VGHARGRSRGDLWRRARCEGYRVRARVRARVRVRVRVRVRARARVRVRVRARVRVRVRVRVRRVWGKLGVALEAISGEALDVKG
jgi:hypothetical protein